MLSLSPDHVLCAYAIGLFPMANDRDDPTIHWIEPRRRGILPLEAFHAPRSLSRLIRRGRFEIRVDATFRLVIESCAAPREERPRTWLNDELIELYCELHERGYAHSVECWRDGRLTGGLYGVAIGAAFFGESMFSHERDASKVALAHLVARLRRGGFRLLDTQFVTDHLRRFGAVEVPREDYRRLLRLALAAEADFLPDQPLAKRPPAPRPPLGLYRGPSQSTTQTS